MNENIIGLDIGGANLKAARTTNEARTHPFQLWKNPDGLATALTELLQGWPVERLAVTMTGELCDCFANKRDGVNRILAQLDRAFPGIDTAIWSTAGRWLPPEQARAQPHAVASANWHALATWIARLPDAREARLVLDVGSTTTDIIPVRNGEVLARGLTDSDRLRTRELVYTGAKRTPLCAVLPEEAMAEFFATTQDAYLLLGKIPEDAAECLTADGRPATRKCAYARLARMLGGDDETIAFEATVRFAQKVHERQCAQISAAIASVWSAMNEAPARLFISGSGEWLAVEVCSTILPKGIATVCLSEMLGPAASAAACAYACAVLAQNEA